MRSDRQVLACARHTADGEGQQRGASDRAHTQAHEHAPHTRTQRRTQALDGTPFVVGVFSLLKQLHSSNTQVGTTDGVARCPLRATCNVAYNMPRDTWYPGQHGARGKTTWPAACTAVLGGTRRYPCRSCRSSWRTSRSTSAPSSTRSAAQTPSPLTTSKPICARTGHICARTGHICAGSGHICARTGPHLRQDWPHLRREWPHLRQDRPTSAPGLATRNPKPALQGTRPLFTGSPAALATTAHLHPLRTRCSCSRRTRSQRSCLARYAEAHPPVPNPMRRNPAVMCGRAGARRACRRTRGGVGSDGRPGGQVGARVWA